VTTGTPICILVRNKDQRSKDYTEMYNKYRPSHADAVYDAKYGVRSVAGGGRASARETVGRVAAGAIAKKILSMYSGVEIVGFVQRVQEIEAKVDIQTVSRSAVDVSIIRCPDSSAAERMIRRVDDVRRSGNSVGGVVEVVARNVPVGLGDPVFDRLEALLAFACLSIPATKGFEIGSGFAGTLSTGFEHNDEFFSDNNRIRTRSNRSGGVQGGISNGECISLRVAFKPTATIAREQNTVTRAAEDTTLRGAGRHDPCVLPRAVPIVEAMVALTLVDCLCRDFAQTHLFPRNSKTNIPLGPELPPPATL
jgi:chorismate synthase